MGFAMRKLAFILAAAASVCFGSASAQQAAQPSPPSAEAYARLPLLSSVGLSPDGRHLVVVVANGDQTELRILDADTLATQRTLAASPGNILREAYWLDDNHPFYTTSAAEHSNWMGGSASQYRQIGVISQDTGRTQLLLGGDSWFSIDAHAFRGLIAGEPNAAHIEARNESSPVHKPMIDVFRVYLDRPGQELIASGNENTVDWVLDDNGAPIVRADVEAQTKHWRLFRVDGMSARPLFDGFSSTGWPPELGGLLADGGLAAIDYDNPVRADQVLRIDLSSGQVTTFWQTPDGSDLGGLLHDIWTGRVVGVSWTDDFTREHFFDPQLEALSHTVAAQFQDGYSTINEVSRDGQRALVFGEHAEDGGAYYLYDAPTQALRRIGQRYPELTGAAALGDREAIKYHARDGTSIPAYLTLPSGVEAHNLPLVVLVHDGPHQRVQFDFDWMSSFLASRGYAVIRSNYRGSGGLGVAWANAGLGRWGDGVEQTDVDDGVAALVRNGIADPSRVCIIGVGYGGYSALVGATLTPHLYACAVSINGLADLAGSIRIISTYQDANSNWWRLQIGDWRTDAAHIRAISPFEHVDAVAAPILLIHSVEDANIPIGQSREMAARLRHAGKNVRLVELEGGDHNLSSEPSRLRVLQELEQFLGQTIGPAAQQSAPAH